MKYVRKFYDRHHDGISESQMTMDRIIRCRNHNPVLSPFITCQLTFEKSNTKGVSNRVFSGVRVT